MRQIRCPWKYFSILALVIWSIIAAYPSYVWAGGAEAIFDNTPPRLEIKTPTDNLATNSGILTLSGSTETDSLLKVNGMEVSVDYQGRFSKVINLNSGKNSLTVTATDPAGNKTTLTRTVLYDNEAPPLTLTAPADNLETGNGMVIVTGYTEAGSRIEINGTSVPTDDEGNFSKAVDLMVNGNQITITAADTAGNKTTVIRGVVFNDNRVTGLTLPEQIKIGSSTAVQYALSVDAYVTINIFDENGDHVRTILDNVLKTAGPNSQYWNGMHSKGFLVPDGKYRFVVEAKDVQGTLIGRAEKSRIAARVPVISGVSGTPEPFNPGKVETAKISCKITGEALVTVTILKDGKPLTVLTAKEFHSGGTYSIEWDGRDDSGNTVRDDKYSYQIEAISPMDASFKSSFLGTVAVEKEAPRITDLTFTSDTLNTGHSTLGIRFNLSEESRVNLQVRDKKGHPVYNIPDIRAGRAGRNSVSWNGKTGSGKYVPPGEYNVVVSAVDKYGKASKPVAKTVKVSILPSPQKVPAGPNFSIPNTFYQKRAPSLIYSVAVEKAAPQISGIAVFPNPFKIGSANLNIKYTLSENAKVSIRIIDSAGSTVKTVLNSVYRNSGFNSSSWDGKDETGSYIRDGVYSVLISAFDSFNKFSGNEAVTFKAGYQAVISNTLFSPQPFNPHDNNNNRATLSYNLSKEALVSVEILKDNMPVGTILNAEWQAGGPKSLQWDGKDNNNKILGDGNYLLRITSKSPATGVFESVYKQAITVEKAAPAITDFNLSPTPFRRYKTKLLSIRYNLSENAKVTLQVYKDGSLIRHIALDQGKKAGYNTASWDGKDESGSYAGTGVYTVVVKAVDPFGKTGEVKKDISFFPDFGVISTEPAENSPGVSINSKIVLSFSDYLKRGINFTGISIQADHRSILYRAELANDTLILTPSDKLAYGTRYTVSIPAGAVKDNSGKAGGAYVFNFTTEHAPRDSAPAEINLSKAAVSVFSVSNKRTVTTVTVNETEATAILDKYPKIKAAVIPVTLSSDLVNAQVTGGLLAALANKNGLLEIRALKGSLLLPAAEIKPDTLARQLGGSVTHLKINIILTFAEAKSINSIQKLAKQYPFSPLGSPIGFKLEAAVGDRKIEIHSFDRYVSLIIHLPPEAKAKATGGAGLNEDGSLYPVPTLAKAEKGKNTAALRTRIAGTYTIFGYKGTFPDIKNHWAKETITNLASGLVINGRGKNTYSPDAKVTRAEFAAMAARALGLKPRVQTLTFRDIKGRPWYAGSVGAAVEAGLMRGYADMSFKPNAYITRQEAAAVIVRALGTAGVDTEINEAGTEENLARFADRATIEPWARTDLAVAVKNELLKGHTKGALNPAKTITRAEVAVIIKRMLVRAGFN